MGAFKKFLSEEKINANNPETEFAVDRGLSSFWREIKMSFPNAKTKDLNPGTLEKLRNVAEKAVKEWLANNTETKNKDPQLNISSFNVNPNEIQNSQWNIYHP